MPAGRVSRSGRHSRMALQKWCPTDKQRLAAKMLHDPGIPNILFDGGVRSGKTESIIRFFATRAEQYPGSTQIMLRKVRRSARYSLWSSLIKHYRQYVPRDRYRLYHDDMLVVHANDSTVQVDGLDDSSRLENIFGTEFITIFVNEATQIGYGFIGSLHARLAQLCRHAVNKGCMAPTKMILDCNPRHRRHWLYRMGVKNVRPDIVDEDIPLEGDGRWEHLTWTPYDNIQNLAPGFIKTHLDPMPEKIRQRMRDGLWINIEGCVYDNFDEDVNILPRFDLNPEYHVMMGVDFGYGAPFAAVWFAVKYDYSHVIAFDEHYYAKRTVNWHAEQIIEKCRKYPSPTVVLCDWEAENRANLEEHGIANVEPADKALLSGIDRVYRAIQSRNGRPPVFQVTQNCINLISELYSYRWPDEDAGTSQRLRSGRDQPVDDNNHALAGVRYVMNYLAMEMDMRSVLLPNVLGAYGRDNDGMGPVKVREGYRIPDVSWDMSYGQEGFGREHFG